MNNKSERFAENKRKSRLANEELKRRQKKLTAYLNSPKAKKLRKAVDDAIDAINLLVDEWNDIVLEDNPYFREEILKRREKQKNAETNSISR